jgi:predicted ATPase
VAPPEDLPAENSERPAEARLRAAPECKRFVMNRFEIRWKSFRGLRDTGWISIKPLTVLIGANAGGKTSVIAPLLILKQTLESGDTSLHLKTIGEYFNAGSYETLVFGHNTRLPVCLGIRFLPPKDPAQEEDLPPVGHHPPNSLELEFGPGQDEHAPILTRYIVRDRYERAMLERRVLKHGRYSVRGLSMSTRRSGLHGAVRNSMPSHFLFDAEGLFRESVRAQAQRIRTEEARGPHELRLDIDAAVNDYINIVMYVSGRMVALLSGISFLGPLSEPPKRLYELSGEIPRGVGVRGQHAPELLFRKRSSALMKRVDDWVSRFDFGFHVSCDELTAGAFNITLRRTRESPQVSFADTGFGLSQVLPLLVQAFYATANDLVVAEQPEIHLNPKLQALLADLFAEVVSRRVGVVVETHSEHLLLRLRRLVAEKKIKSSDVALLYVERQGDESVVRQIPIEPNGHIDMRDWPRGFFEDSMKEALALASAQSRTQDA